MRNIIMFTIFFFTAKHASPVVDPCTSLVGMCLENFPACFPVCMWVEEMSAIYVKSAKGRTVGG